MSAKYFIVIRPQTNEHHSVHKDGCPFLPDGRKRIYLGRFRSSHEAVIEGKRHFDKSDRCLFCTKENNFNERKNVYAEIAFSQNILTIDRFPVTSETAFQCGIN